MNNNYLIFLQNAPQNPDEQLRNAPTLHALLPAAGTLNIEALNAYKKGTL